MVNSAHAEVYFNQRHYYIMESDRYIAINIVIARKNFYQSFYLEVRPSYIRGTESSQTGSYLLIKICHVPAPFSVLY